MMVSYRAAELRSMLAVRVSSVVTSMEGDCDIFPRLWPHWQSSLRPWPGCAGIRQ